VNTLYLLPIAAWISIVVFYYLYLGAINVYENRAGVHWAVLLVSSPLLLVMLAFDFVMQMTLATLIFWDRPRELLVTARLKRYRLTRTDWREHWAKQICTHALNPFDPTKKHC